MIGGDSQKKVMILEPLPKNHPGYALAPT